MRCVLKHHTLIIYKRIILWRIIIPENRRASFAEKVIKYNADGVSSPAPLAGIARQKLDQVDDLLPSAGRGAMRGEGVAARRAIEDASKAGRVTEEIAARLVQTGVVSQEEARALQEAGKLSDREAQSLYFNMSEEAVSLADVSPAARGGYPQYSLDARDKVAALVNAGKRSRSKDVAAQKDPRQQSI